jgi:metallo-beta-lactamase family protein
MKITFHGAARTVTGSQHLLTVQGKRLLLDCGLFQGRRKDTYKRNLNFPFSPTSIEAVVLSHAHIDHCGNLPNLVRQGFEGPIHATLATADLTEILLRDSGHIQEADVEFVNKRRARRGEPPVEPLYTIAQAEEAGRLLVGHTYNQPFEPIPGAQVTLVDAGHILGSAEVALNLEEKGRAVRMMFSGDIGRYGLPILRDPTLPQNIEYLIMECTYGDRNHNHPDQAYEDLREVVSRTVARGGKVIIPAFAVGRTQAIVYYLHQMIDRGQIPDLPVFVDSPLAIDVTQVFRAHPECFDKEILAFMRQDERGAAFGFDHLTYTRSVESSKAINDIKEPVIIISASGMVEVGRILHHLRNNIHDPRNTILITSWMAPHTLGRRLAEGAKEVRIFGEPHHVNAEVVTINGLSAHADQEFLLLYALASKETLRRIFLVHGEQRAAEALMGKLHEAGFDRVHYASPGESFEL